MSIAFLSQGQETAKYLRLKATYNYKEGYIISFDTIKIIGLIKTNISRDEKKYEEVIFVHQDCSKKKYKPLDIIGYGYSSYRYESSLFSFLRIVQTGKHLNLYRTRTDNLNGGKMAYSSSNPFLPSFNYASMEPIETKETYYVRKTNRSNFMRVDAYNFKGVMSMLAKDCPELLMDIKNETLTYVNISRVVRMYNLCYK